MPELDATELPRVDEDQLLAAGHPQFEVVVRRRLAVRVARFEAAGHPEMDAEPGAPGEAEGHLLRRGDGLDEFRPGQGRGQRRRSDPPADPRLGIETDGGDLAPQAEVPAAAEIFDFGELGHRRTPCGGPLAAQAARGFPLVSAVRRD